MLSVDQTIMTWRFNISKNKKYKQESTMIFDIKIDTLYFLVSKIDFMVNTYTWTLSLVDLVQYIH